MLSRRTLICPGTLRICLKSPYFQAPDTVGIQLAKRAAMTRKPEILIQVPLPMLPQVKVAIPGRGPGCQVASCPEEAIGLLRLRFRLVITTLDAGGIEILRT